MVDSENTTETQCYNISVYFQDEGICDLFGQSCNSIDLLTQLSKGNKSDPVSFTEDSAEVVVEVPDQCKCSTSTQPDNETTTQIVTSSDNGQTVTQSDRQSIVITASVLSVVVAIAIAALMMMIIFYYRKTRILVTKNNTEE